METTQFDIHSIILFDGYCNFCSWGIQFLLRRDKQNSFLFAASQSEGGKRVLASYNIEEVESVIYVRKGVVYKSSAAVLLVLHDLGYPWKLFYVFILVPKFIRNAIYNAFAKVRYSLFGRRKVCRMPNENEKNRFL